MTCDRLDGAAPLSVPALTSLPTAEKKIYLDFDGDIHRNWGSWADIGGTSTQGPIPVYDIDGDRSCFSAAEVQNIRDIFEVVKEKFSPFQIDITTIDPLSLEDGRTGKVVIGGDGAWYGRGGGVAQRGGFYGSGESVSYVWDSPANVRYVGEAVTHEIGHMMWLKHQSLYDGETLVREYRPDFIMCAGHTHSSGGRWGIGTSTGVDSFDGSIDRDDRPQDDFTKLLGEGLSLRPDDHGNDRMHASSLQSTEFGYQASGILEREVDVDYFVLDSVTPGTRFTVSLNANSFAPMLDPRLEIYDAAGTLVRASETEGVYNETITIESSVSSRYFIAARSAANPENVYSLGQYTLGVYIGQSDDDSPATATSLVGIPEDRTFFVGTFGRHVMNDVVSETDVWDWYIVQPPNESVVTFSLTNLTANANLYGFDFHNRVPGNIVFASTKEGNLSETATYVAPRTPYQPLLVGVQHFEGPATGYQLTVNVDRDPNPIFPGSFSVFSQGQSPSDRVLQFFGSIQPGDSDLIIADDSWSLVSNRIAAAATMTSYSGAANLKVGYDINRNKQLDTAEIVETAFVPANSPTRVSNYPYRSADGHRLLMEASSSAETNYQLAFTAEFYRPTLNVSLDELGWPLADLGVTTHQVSFADQLDKESPIEVISLGLVPPGPMNFAIKQQGPALVDYQLVRDANGNGTVDQGEVVATGADIKHEVPVDNKSPYYFIAALSPQSNVPSATYEWNYADAIANSAEGSDAKNPRKLQANESGQLDGFVATNDSFTRHREHYVVEVETGGQLNLALTLEKTTNPIHQRQSDVRVTVGRDVNNNGLIDLDERMVSRASQGGKSFNLAVNVDQGAYLMTVEMEQGDAQTLGFQGSDYRIAFDVSEFSDSTPVTVEGAEVVKLDELSAIKIVFSEDIGSSLGIGDIKLSKLNSPSTSVAALDEVYLPEDRTLYLVLDPSDEAGDYQVEIGKARIADALGNALEEAFHFDFTIEPEPARIPGDANEDGKVEFEDFLILSRNFGKQADAVWGDGDFDGDGKVAFADFLLLAANFGRDAS